MPETVRRRPWGYVLSALAGAALGALVTFFASLTLLSDSYVDAAAFTAANRLQTEMALLAYLRRNDVASARARLETRIREGALHLEAVRSGLSGETRRLVDRTLQQAVRLLGPAPASSSSQAPGSKE